MSARHAAAAFLHTWQQLPPIARFLAALDDGAAGDLPRALAAADALLDDVTWVGATVAALADRIRVDPGFVPPFAAIGDGARDGLLLVDHPGATVTLAVVAFDLFGARKAAVGGAGSIGFSGVVTRYRVLRANGARLAWWAAPAIDDAFDARSAGTCHRTGHKMLFDGDLIAVDGRSEAFIVESLSGDLVLLQVTLTAGRAPLAVEYDAVTHAFAAASATDPAASHRQMMATLLRRLGRVDAVPQLAALACDPAFFVRWHAVRELAALDPVAARPLLATMAANDPRGDIAAAAAAALARLNMLSAASAVARPPQTAPCRA